MKFVLKIFFTILYCILVNTIELNYLRGVPRLGNTSYWDYYFNCKTVGQTLQWEVNGDPLGGFLSGDIGRILFSSRTNFDFIATLLSAKPTSGNQYTLDSVLIVSLTRNSSLDVICGNGNSFIVTNNTESRTNVENMTITSSVSLQHLLTEDIVREDNLKISIFVCGVDSELLIWQTDVPYAFFALPNSVGQKYQILQQQNTSIKQQAFIISREPYELVSVLFVVGLLDEYVQCASRESTLQFRIKSYLDGTTTASTTTTTTASTTATTTASTTTTTTATNYENPTNNSESQIEIDNIRVLIISICVGLVSCIFIMCVLPVSMLVTRVYKRRRDMKSHKYAERFYEFQMTYTKRENPVEIDLKEQYQSRLGYLKIAEKSLLNIIMEEYQCPVKIRDFSTFVKNAIKFGEFYNEFELIKTRKPENSSVSIAMKNSNKNRLQDDLPYDDSLVKITKVNGMEGSDYINASYIDGCMKNKEAYIAAQVPMPNTIADFWRMIYEHQITTIVMFRERLQWKYEPYWPNNVGDKEHQNGTRLNVIYKEQQKVKNYNIRILEVHNTAKRFGSKKPLRVTHYEFLGWPFSGVPYNFSILDFIEDVRKQPNISTPIVVLSTMGGPTGVFITLDTIMQQINKYKQECSIEVFDFVRSMWQKRTRMVQTAEQYIYIYEALEKYIEDLPYIIPSQPHDYSSFIHELEHTVEIHHSTPAKIVHSEEIHLDKSNNAYIRTQI